MPLRLLVTLLSTLVLAGAATATPEDPARAAGSIHDVLREQLALSSRWSGVVRADAGVDGGLITPRGDIHLNPGLTAPAAATVRRDQILTHELLHAFSRGSASMNAYRRHMGWEEGVVEGVRQLVQPSILHALGHPPTRHHDLYPGYTRALESLRRSARMQPGAFYRTLLKIPLPRRRATVRAWIRRTPGAAAAWDQASAALSAPA